MVWSGRPARSAAGEPPMEADKVPASFQAVCVAITLGVLISAWAYEHFHAQYRPEQIRFSVPQDRYFFALSIHICTIAAVYALAILFFYSIRIYRWCENCSLLEVSRIPLDPEELI